MAAAAHDPAFAKKTGVPQSVAREFNQADKGSGIMNKGYQGRTASYAKGGEVLGRTKDFMKTPDRFRESQFKKKTEDVFPKGAVNTGKDKSLTPVKPKR